jgi:hypothetical protein
MCRFMGIVTESQDDDPDLRVLPLPSRAGTGTPARNLWFLN